MISSEITRSSTTGQYRDGPVEDINRIKTKTIPIHHISNNPHKTYYNTKVNQNDALVDRYHNLKSNDNSRLNDIRASPTPHKYQYINEYKEETVYIEPNTINYQIDNLYRKLIDYCIDKNLKIFKEFVFNKKLQDEFHKFCLNNTDFNI